MPHSQFDVLGIGNAIVDVIAHADDAFITSHGMPKGSMALIDEAAAEAIYGAMGAGIQASGGSAANSCAGLASLGSSVAYIGKVKSDALGTVFAHDMRSIGVRFDTAPATDGPATARCLILVTPDAERTMNTFLGACVDLKPEDIDEALVASAQYTYLEGYLFDPPLAKEAFRKASRVARASGRKVALSLSDPFCVNRYRDEFRALVDEHVDVLFANEAEIMALYNAASFEDAIAAVKGSASIAAITCGSKGSVLVTETEQVGVPAAPVQRVVDTTGAGDLYAAGVLHGLSKGFSLAECGRIGSIAAGEIISHFGARPEADLAALIR